MEALQVRLFGKFSISYGGHAIDELGGHKARELFAYLLLHRDRPQSREVLAGVLWGDCTTAQSKKYLRQALWQLQGVLQAGQTSQTPLLVSPSWVEIPPDAGFWLDVAVLERTFTKIQGVSIESLDADAVTSLQSAVELYSADLLEGWYQDWCTYERERLRGIYLTMLDKLTAYCELHGLVDAGIRCANRSLRQDRARERTHQQLMRLYCIGGDRAAALRQYDRCVIALDEELGVKPSEATSVLYEQIKAPGGALGLGHVSALLPMTGPEVATLSGVLGRLRQLEADLSTLGRQVRTEIKAVEGVLGAREHTWPDGRPARRALATVAPAVEARSVEQR